MSFHIITINFTKITYYINTPIHINQKVNRKSHSILGADFMEKKPIVFKVPPNSKLKVTFFGPCNEVITNVSIINQLRIPKCQTITQYPDYKKYETEVQSLSRC